MNELPCWLLLIVRLYGYGLQNVTLRNCCTFRCFFCVCVSLSVFSETKRRMTSKDIHTHTHTIDVNSGWPSPCGIIKCLLCKCFFTVVSGKSNINYKQCEKKIARRKAKKEERTDKSDTLFQQFSIVSANKKISIEASFNNKKAVSLYNGRI